MRRIRRNGNIVVEDGRGIGRDHRLLGGIVRIVVMIVIIEMEDGEKEMGMADDDEMIPNAPNSAPRLFEAQSARGWERG
jgi:hypothetical protein